jgi:hypothetical protein
MNEKQLKKLRENLTKADIIDIAIACLLAESSVRSVLYGHRKNINVIEAALAKAEKNKKKNLRIINKVKAL